MTTTNPEPTHKPFPEEWFDLPPEVDPYWRDERVPFNYPADYGRRNDYFTMKIFANGRFRKVGVHRMYQGGWVKYLDYQRPRNTRLWRTMLTLGDMGITGICYLWYLKPGSSMNNGLVWLKDEEDMKDMMLWTKGIREIRIYVSHAPSWKLGKTLFLSEIYDEWRHMWPKPVLEEISDEEASLLGYRGVEEYKGIVTLKRSQLPKETNLPNLLRGGMLLLKGGCDVVGAEVGRVEVERCEVDDKIDGDEVAVDVEGVEVEGCEVNDKVVGDDVVIGDVVLVDDVVTVEVEGAEKVADEGHEVEGTEVQGPEKVSDYRHEVEGTKVHGPEVQGPEVDDVDEWMEGNNVVYDRNVDVDHEDYDLETESFMREDVCNYSNEEESSDLDMEGEASNERTNCYGDEDEALEDMRPLLNDLGTSTDVEFEQLDELTDMSEDEDEEAEVGCSSNKPKEKEKGNNAMQFNKSLHIKNPVLVPGMMLGSASDFKQLIREYVVQTKKPLKFVKNDKLRVRVISRQEGCGFSVFCSKVGKSNDLSIKTLVEEHTYGTTIAIPTVTVKWLAKRYVNKVRRNPKISLKSFIGDIFDDMNVEISRTTTWRAIKQAGYLMFGNDEQQFARLWSYAKELLDIMPGSTVIVKQHEQKFERVYVCPAPLKKGFLSGCRKFICIDGCFLKGAFKGQILAAVGLDGNNGIYPIAWAVVEVENTDSWTWFIRLLKEDLMMEQQPDSWILMTDQQKGLENAISNELPEAEHRLCVKHLHANWSKRFPGTMLKNMMWKCARAGSEAYFEYRMQRLKVVTVEGYEALRRIDPKKWCKYTFRIGSNCPELVNNWVEAFNVFIMRARDQPIITMLNTIYHTIMTRIEEERGKKLKWKGVVCPRVDETLRLMEKKINEYVTRASGSPRYEVTSAKHSFAVDLEKMECSCRMWQLEGVPCIHAVCVYKARNKDPRRYVHKDFHLSTWFHVYNNFLEPLRGPIFWTKSPYPAILPPDLRVLSGRPKRCRNKDAAERAEEAEERAELIAKKKKNVGVFRASRRGVVMHCKICGGEGHNARTCPRKPAPTDGGSSSQPTPTDGGRSSQPAPTDGRTSSQPAPTDGRSSSQPATSSKTKKGKPDLKLNAFVD